MRVKDCMCKKVVQATSNTMLNEVAKLMEENDVGVIPICDNNTIVGCVTDRDIVTRCVATNKECSQTKVSDIMTENVVKITPDTELSSAIQIMAHNQIKRLPVIENNQIVGMLTIGDLAQNQNVPTKEVGCAIEGICED